MTDIDIVCNFDGQNHLNKIDELLEDCTHLDCAVAFLTNSGLNLLKDKLNSNFVAGMKARLIIGLDFFITDPEALIYLLNKAKKYENIQIWAYRSEKTVFHPKIYRFKCANGNFVIVGSANFTGGGLNKNHEISTVFQSDCTKKLDRFFKNILESSDCRPLDESVIEDYRKKQRLFKAHLAILKKEFAETNEYPDIALDVFKSLLKQMRRGGKNSRFAEETAKRKESRETALKLLREIANRPRVTRKRFEEIMEDLFLIWRSSGLQRAKTSIFENKDRFCYIVEVSLAKKRYRTAERFEQMRRIARDGGKFGAGTNLLTEVLQSTNNQHFAIMNQNAVSGINIMDDQFACPPTIDKISGQTMKDSAKFARILPKSLD